MKLPRFDNWLGTVGTDWSGRLYRVGRWAIVPFVVFPLASACSRSDLGAAEPKGGSGKATSGQVGRAYPSAEGGDSAKLARPQSDKSIEELLDAPTGVCKGVPAATLRPDTGLAPVPAATPAYCPFPR